MASIRITDTPLCDSTISPMQNGQFIEYLCNLVPGMWAEKLCDGDFVGLSPYKFAFVKEKDFQEHPWYPSGEVQAAGYATDSNESLNGVSSQRIEIAGQAVAGLSQDGISVRRGQPCILRIWARTAGTADPAEVRLHEGPKTLARGSFTPSSEWRAYSLSVDPIGDSDAATLTIQFDGPGKLWLACASLMPNDTVGGWRKDVVAALRDINPSVIRIGGSVMDDPNLGDFHWQETVGPVEKRKPFRAWGGLQPVGSGLEEVVQLIRAAGAEPLICIRFRLNTPQGAADEVQYFNGALDTPMGSLRAKNGHPKPYGIKYWQIGNEQASPEYEASLPEFCKAIKAADPSAQLLSSFPTEGVLKGARDWLAFTVPTNTIAPIFKRKAMSCPTFER